MHWIEKCTIINNKFIAFITLFRCLFIIYNKIRMITRCAGDDECIQRSNTSAEQIIS